MLSARLVYAAVALGVTLAPVAVVSAQTTLVQQCLGGDCRNGRLHSVVVTPDDYVVLIDPDRCDRRMACPTAYPAIEVDGDHTLRVDGYTPGDTPAEETFSIWVPRRFETLHFRRIDGSERDVALELKAFAETE